MKIVRLENTSFGFSSLREDEVEKLVEFNSENGALKVHALQSPRRVPFGSAQTDLIQEFLGQNLNDGTVQVIHNPPVPNAYSRFTSTLRWHVRFNARSACQKRVGA